MARKKDRYRAYVYEETAHSGKGILAAVLGGVSLLIFLLLAGICAALAGGAENGAVLWALPPLPRLFTDW